jgi:molybdenum cofactor cytidylyltransferase
MIRGILLAGGASVRFGAPKLLHPFEDDLTIGQVAARNLIAGAGNALAVVRDGDAELAARLRAMGCEVLETVRAREGMGASLAAAIEGSRAAQGWVVALADMPRIRPETIAAIVQALGGGALIAAPVLAGQSTHGHPVGFAAGLREELLELAGDRGARSVLERHRANLVLVPVADEGIHEDIDRPGDLGSA